MGEKPVADRNASKGRSMQNLDPLNWKSASPSSFDWEQKALDFIKSQFPKEEPYRAWSNIEFIGNDRKPAEVDLLLFTPQSFFLVEIKSDSGRLSGNQGYWTWEHPDGHTKTYKNPFLLANKKAKQLRGLLQSQAAFENLKVPWIDPLIFCSGDGVKCELEGPALTGVCFRDGDVPGHPGIMAAILRRECPGLSPTYATFDSSVAKAIENALVEIGAIGASRAVGRIDENSRRPSSDTRARRAASLATAAQFSHNRLEASATQVVGSCEKPGTAVANTFFPPQTKERWIDRLSLIPRPKFVVLSLLAIAALMWGHHIIAEEQENGLYDVCQVAYDQMLSDGATLDDFSRAEQKCTDYLHRFGKADRSVHIRAIKQWLDQVFARGVIEIDAEKFHNSAWIHSPGMKIEIVSENSVKLSHFAPKVRNDYDLGFLGSVSVPWKASTGMKVRFSVGQGTPAEQVANALSPELLKSGRSEYTLSATDDSDYTLLFAERLTGIAASFPDRP